MQQTDRLDAFSVAEATASVHVRAVSLWCLLLWSTGLICITKDILISVLDRKFLC